MEVLKLQLNRLVKDQSTEILARSKIKAIASRLDFSEFKTEQILLSCKEIISNQLKFSIGAGLVQIWEHKYPVNCLDIFAYDMGPGIENLNNALKDGYSTSNTLGHGLGSLVRSSDICEIYTKTEKKDKNDPWTGTALWCRFFPKLKSKDQFIDYGIFIRALNDNVFNGDFIKLYLDNKSFKFIHLDGLGHGKAAHKSGVIANEVILKNLSPIETIETLNQSLSNERKANGVAISLDNKGNFLYSGYGNVSLKKLESDIKLKSFHLQNRTIGEIDMDICETRAMLKQNESLISYSDGILSNWNLEHYPGLFLKHPQLVAYLLGNLFSRGNDDSSLIITKLKKEIK